jgi:hypothetical protein
MNTDGPDSIRRSDEIWKTARTSGLERGAASLPRAGSQPNPSADATGIAVEPESKSIPNPCMSWSPDSWPIAMQDWHLGTLVTANFSVGWLSLTSPYLEVVQSGTTQAA